MAVYAQLPRRRVGQIAADLFVVGWTVAWILIGRSVHGLVSALAEPARRTAATATRLAGSFRDAGDQAAGLPGVGEQLRRPFDTAAESVGGLIGAAEQQAAGLERLATAAGWIVFAIPVLLVVVFWLPRRIAFVQHSRAAQALLDSAAGLDLFALRALASQPLPVLARVSRDPAADWRAGNPAVIDRLAELELGRSGLRRPDSEPIR